MTAVFNSPYGFGDRVYLPDGTQGVVIGVTFYADGRLFFQCSRTPGNPRSGAQYPVTALAPVTPPPDGPQPSVTVRDRPQPSARGRARGDHLRIVTHLDRSAAP